MPVPDGQAGLSGFPWPIDSTRLANGLRVIVSEDHTAPVVAVNLWYDVGSRHEPAGQSGFAHLFEHLMFEGSLHVPKAEHMRLIQGAGGTLNASTSPDRTNYFETVPAEHLELALWLEADRMGALVPALTQETLDNQREVVKNERRQRYDNVPYGDAWLRLLALLYPPGHPYHHATIGSMADLDAADLDTFKAFHTTWYAPNNAVLTVVGDTDAATVFALAEKYFGGLPPNPDLPAPPAAGGDGRMTVDGGAGEPRETRETVVARVEAPRVYLACRTYPFGSAAYNAVTVLATVLGTGRGSRLYRRLADGARLAQPDTVIAHSVEFAHAPAPLIVTATARPGVSAEALEAGLAALLDELAAGDPAAAVTEAELERAKALLTTAWWQQVATAGGRADTLSQYAIQLGDPARAAEQLPAWLAVSAEQVAETAAAVLQPRNRVTLTYLPASASEPDSASKEAAA